MIRMYWSVSHNVLCSTLAHDVNGCHVKRRVSGLINLGKVLPKKLDFFTAEPLRAFYMVKYILNLQEGI